MLCHESNWSGILIEANSDRVKDLSQLYSDRNNNQPNDVKCLERHVNVQPIKNNNKNNEDNDSINHILYQYNMKNDIDFISIDIDGADYHIWNNLCNKSQSISYSPKVICIEFNPTIPNNIVFILEYIKGIHY